MDDPVRFFHRETASFSRIDEVKAEHIKEFIQLPALRTPVCHRSIEETRRIREDGALLFLSLIAESEIDPLKEAL